jgi:hypothetical protein
MGPRVHHLLSPGAGAIVLIAWAAALVAIGVAHVARRDINERRLGCTFLVERERGVDRHRQRIGRS